LFRELLALSRSLSDEEQRHVREQLTEEELTVFDLLTRPGPDLTPEEREEVKKANGERHVPVGILAEHSLVLCRLERGEERRSS
jgi:hypothetical protein